MSGSEAIAKLPFVMSAMSNDVPPMSEHAMLS